MTDVTRAAAASPGAPTAPSRPALLVARDVGVTTGELTLVEPISLALGRGELVAVIGPRLFIVMDVLP